MGIKEEAKKNFNKQKYDKEYNKTHYKKVTIRLKFDESEEIEKYCTDFNISVNSFVKMCCKYAINELTIDELKRYK